MIETPDDKDALHRIPLSVVSDVGWRAIANFALTVDEGLNRDKPRSRY